jgi:signal peptidase II
VLEGRQLKLIPIFDLTRVHNYGISLGLARRQNDTHAGSWSRDRRHRRRRRLVDSQGGTARRPAGLAMILGGALGNIVDRVQFGYVVDFLDLHFGGWRPFYVFNVGDAAISIGVVILLLRAFLLRGTGRLKERMNMRKALSSSLRRSCSPAAACSARQAEVARRVRRRPQCAAGDPARLFVDPAGAGTVSMTAQDAQGQAIQALFGGRLRAARPKCRSWSAPAVTAPRSHSLVGGRSNTRVVDKGQSTQTILAAPQADSQEASAQTPGQ